MALDKQKRKWILLFFPRANWYSYTGRFKVKAHQAHVKQLASIKVDVASPNSTGNWAKLITHRVNTMDKIGCIKSINNKAQQTIKVT